MIACLPGLMVAPTGARRTRNDHPQLPISVEQIVATARSCEKAGADGIHIHVRDGNNVHILDAGLYIEVLNELKTATPTLALQITTEAVGQYSPMQQRKLVKVVRPTSVSVSLSEMLATGEFDETIEFYRWCQDEGVAVQHILYSTDDLALFQSVLDNPLLKLNHPQLLFVLGRYARNQESSPDDLKPFTQWLDDTKLDCDWAVCAFGKSETECLVAANALGGKLRVGFENSLWNKDGSVAKDNAERVEEVARSIKR